MNYRLLLLILLIYSLINISDATTDGMITFNKSEQVIIYSPPVVNRSTTNNYPMNDVNCSFNLSYPNDTLLISDGLMVNIGNGIYKNVSDGFNVSGVYHGVIYCNKSGYSGSTGFEFRISDYYSYDYIINEIKTEMGVKLTEIKQSIYDMRKGTNLHNIALDFDLGDESKYYQEDAVSGTDFTSDGLLTLHNSGGVGDNLTYLWNVSPSDVYNPLLINVSSESAYLLEDLTNVEARWCLDNTSSGYAVDSSNNGNDGTIIGGVTQATDYKVDGAYVFDGSTGYVDLGATNTYATSNKPFSVSLWFKTTDVTPLYSVILALKTDLNNQFQITYSTDTNYKLLFVFGGYTGVKVDLPSKNAWHHLVMVYDGVSKTDPNSYTIYIDGVSQLVSATPLGGGSTNANAIGFRIGGNYQNYFNGTIDEVIITNKTLSSDEVTYLYNSSYGMHQWFYSKNSPQVSDSTGLDDSNGVAGFLNVTFNQSINTINNNITYTVSYDNSSWLYYNGSSWVLSDSITKTNNATYINEHINELPVLSNQLYFKAYLNSDGLSTPYFYGLNLSYNRVGSDYPTNAYIVTTTDDNQIAIIDWEKINGINITSDEPSGTSVKWLVSFSDRQNWSYYNGINWSCTDNLSDISTVGMTTNTLESISPDAWETACAVTFGNSSYLDFAIQLNTSNQLFTPSIDLIDIDYNSYGTGFWKIINDMDSNMELINGMKEDIITNITNVLASHNETIYSYLVATNESYTSFLNNILNNETTYLPAINESVNDNGDTLDEVLTYSINNNALLTTIVLYTNETNITTHSVQDFLIDNFNCSVTNSTKYSVCYYLYHIGKGDILFTSPSTVNQYLSSSPASYYDQFNSSNPLNYTTINEPDNWTYGDIEYFNESVNQSSNAVIINLPSLLMSQKTDFKTRLDEFKSNLDLRIVNFNKLIINVAIIGAIIGLIILIVWYAFP